MTKKLFHLPVLHQEILNQLCQTNIQTFFDGTLGLGGHAELIMQTFPDLKKYIATELDPEHLNYAKQRLEKFDQKLETHNTNFSKLGDILQQTIQRPLAILLDLGLCSNHVDTAEKGFSFQSDGPLKMSFDGTNGAEKFLNEATESDLSRVLKEYGEIRHHKTLAKKITTARTEKPLKTTGDLKKIIEDNTHPRERKKILVLAFQAIRMEVNNEINVIKTAIKSAFSVMQSGDRLGIISYHSLEDRLVKQLFKQVSKPITAADNFSLHSVVKEADYFLQTKKPILPSSKEIHENSRSRSAKLRIIQKK